MNDRNESGDLSTDTPSAVDGFLGRFTSTADNGLMFTVILDEAQKGIFLAMNPARGTRLAVAFLHEDPEAQG